MKKGFERLRHVAVAGSIGLGLFGGGSARAATVALPVTKLARGSVEWLQVQNASLSISDSNSSIIATSNGITIPINQSAFAIDDAQLIDVDQITNGLDNAFNAALFMAARSAGTTAFFVNPDADVDLSGDNLKSDLVANFVTGIDAQINYYFHPTRPLVRALYSFTNNTGANIDIEALIGGTLGSVGSTTVQASSDDNTTSDAADLWIISNNQTTLGDDPDSNVATDTPVITISRFGDGATTTAANALALGNFAGVFGHRYDFTVAANSTAHVLVFAELNKTIADAKTCAKDFETLDAADASGLLTGLSTSINFADIVNYAAATGATFVSTCSHTASGTNTTTNTNTGSSSTTDSNSTTDSTTSSTTTSTTEKDLSTGALDLVSLATLLGLLGLARVRKKESS